MDFKGDSSYKCKLTKDELLKAQEELHEDPKQIASHIAALRDWVLQQPHLTSRTDDEFLIRFLRAAKYSQSRAQKQLDHYITMRCGDTTRNWYNQTGQLSDKELAILRSGVTYFLPETDDEGRTVAVIKSGHYDVKEYHIDDVFRLGNNLAEVCLKHREAVQVHGVVVMLDFGEFTVSHMASFTPNLTRRAAQTWQECIPYRQKGLNYYNTPTIFNVLFELLKLFLKEKIKKRITLHKSSLDSLYSKIPKRILPEEYGGDAGPEADIIAYNERVLLEHAEEMKKNAVFRLDESQRPSLNSGQTDDWGGVAGSFRKLNAH